MRRFRAHAASYGIAVFIWLWSDVIGPEAPPGRGPASVATAPPAGKGAPPAPEAKAHGALPAFDTRKDAPIDREAFIASFKRQARAEALPCLLTWQPSPSSLHLAATLLKAGTLRNLRPVGAEAALPDCLAPAVERMDFAPLTALMKTNAQELQWRADW